jgi:hypothetical protein
MLCPGGCRPRIFACAVIVRSQLGDACNAEVDGLGCGPRRLGPDVGICEVGVVNRALVDTPGACTEALYRTLTREACEAYRKKNAGKPLDEFDPSREIGVTRRFEPYDGAGNIIYQWGKATFRCPRPSAVARPRARPRIRSER